MPNIISVQQGELFAVTSGVGKVVTAFVMK